MFEQWIKLCQDILTNLTQMETAAVVEKAIKELSENSRTLTQEQMRELMKDATTKIANFVIQAAVPVYTHVSPHDRLQIDKAIQVVKDYLKLDNANAQTILNATRSGLILCRICCPLIRRTPTTRSGAAPFLR